VNSGGPKRAPLDPQLCGIYYGIVCQNKDEEGKVARVKVRFPWLPGGDKDQAHWALLAVLMEGEKFGTYTVPEIDDTVMVVFLHGDIRRPVVIGGMWNKTDTPPEVNENGKNDFRFIKSRSGHRFLLDDSSKVKVVITDKDNKNYIGCGEFAKGGDGRNAFEMAGPHRDQRLGHQGRRRLLARGQAEPVVPQGHADHRRPARRVHRLGQDRLQGRQGHGARGRHERQGGGVAGSQARGQQGQHQLARHEQVRPR
jgi:hypothetical protein